jgi:hypothetical protein
MSYLILYAFNPICKSNHFYNISYFVFSLQNLFETPLYYFIFYGHPSIFYGRPFIFYGRPFIFQGCPSIFHGCPSIFHGCPSIFYGCPFIFHGRPSIFYGRPFIFHFSRIYLSVRQNFPFFDRIDRIYKICQF